LNIKIIKNSPNYPYNLLIFLFSLFLILFKWVFSYYQFNDENLLNKIIFEIQDFYYFPHIIYLLELDFSPNYLENYLAENFIPTPIFSVIFHSIFLKLFGFLGFIFLEFISVYLFLFIFIKFFLKLNIDLPLATLSSILILMLPSLFNFIEIFGLNFPNLENFYSLRFPRPLLTSVFFLWGLYLSISYFISKNNYIREYVFIAIVLGLTFSSYYYNFIHLSLIFLFIFILKNFENRLYFKNNYQKLILSLIIFIVIILPFFTLFYFSEADFLSRVGVISLDGNKKFILLNHLLEKIFSLKFLPLFLINVVSLITLYNLDESLKKKITFIFFLFFSVLFSPFVFIIISPSVSEIYHFLNWIVIVSILVPIINLIILSNYYLKINDQKKIFKFFIYFFLIFTFCIFQINHLKNLKKTDISLKKDFYKLQNLIDNNKQIESFMTFIPRAQVMLILKDKKKFTTIESSFSSHNFNQLEKSFIQNLIFLGVNRDNFIKIIENKKTGWRYTNDFVRYLSWYKYQANSLMTYEDTNNYSNIELEHILRSSPTRTQQIIIPSFEFKRLASLFDDLILNKNFTIPDLIILEKESVIDVYSNVNYEIYCEIKNYVKLKIYANKNLKICN